MKQSELYSNILESETADKMVSRDTQASMSPDYTVRDAYNDWKSCLPDMPEDSEAFRQLGKIKDQKYKEALGLASVAEYNQSHLFAFLKLDRRKGWGDDIGNYKKNPSSVRHGIFASAPAEALEAQEVRVLDMSGVFEPGYRNRSDLILEGNIGDSFGRMMESGKVTVKGGSELNLAHTMKDGEIEFDRDVGNHLGAHREDHIAIKGSAKDHSGQTMHDGTISVERNAGRHVGEVITGGEIEIKRDAEEEIGMHLLREPRENPVAEITSHGEGEPHDCLGAKIFKVQNGSKQRTAP